MRKAKEKITKLQLNMFEKIIAVVSIFSIVILLLAIIVSFIPGNAAAMLLYLVYFNYVQVYITIFIFLAAFYELIDLKRLKYLKKISKSKVYFNRIFFLVTGLIASFVLSTIICAVSYSLQIDCNYTNCSSSTAVIGFGLFLTIVISTFSTLLVHIPFLTGCFLADKHYCDMNKYRQ